MIIVEIFSKLEVSYIIIFTKNLMQKFKCVYFEMMFKLTDDITPIFETYPPIAHHFVKKLLSFQIRKYNFMLMFVFFFFFFY